MQNRINVGVSTLFLLGAASFVAAGCTIVAERDDEDDDDKQQPASGEGEGEGEGELDNVGACGRWVESVQCGSVDPGMYVDCNQYSALGCDISDYFTCLSQKTSCVNDMLDATRWGECASLAACT